jgi:small subunit ribosomal protein S1
MSAHHVDSPEQVVTPGEELWVKIIDLDLARRRISLSIKQAAEGGELAAEYREHFEVDSAGNWVQGETSAEAEAAWSEYYGEGGEGAAEAAATDAAPAAEAPADEAPADEAPAAEAATEEAPAAEAVAEESPVVEAAEAPAVEEEPAE